MTRDWDEGAAHVVDLLPDYANRTLDAAEEEMVGAHLARCPACRLELRTWRHIATTLRSGDTEVAPPSPHVLAHIQAAIAPPRAPMPGAPRAGASPTTRRRWGHIWAVLRVQGRLIRPGVWLAAALGIAGATLYAATVARPRESTLVLAFVFPLVCAAGIALVYGPEVDPTLEIARATPTPPRQVLLSRWALLIGYNLALALGATTLLATLHGRPPWDGLALWLGPMAVLAAFGALLSLLAGPVTAVGGVLAVWMTRLFPLDHGLTVGPRPDPFWQTSPLMFALAAALALLTVVAAERQERFA